MSFFCFCIFFLHFVVVVAVAFVFCQIDAVEERINQLTIEAPMVMRSVKTRTAARIMVERFREATEVLAENVSIHLVVQFFFFV